MLADFLWLCHLQMLHTTSTWAAIQRTRDPNIEGDGGPTNVKARVAVFKTLWKFLRIISLIITKLMK